MLKKDPNSKLLKVKQLKLEESKKPLEILNERLILTSRKKSKKKLAKRKSVLITNQTRTINEDYSPIRKLEKKRTQYDFSKNPRISLNTFFKEQEEKVEKNIKYKKRLMIINILSKERAKLKKLLVLTTDIFALRLLSQKIMRLNIRINKLININEGLLPEPEEKKRKKKQSNLSFDSSDSYSIDENEVKPIYNKIKKINNYLKINQIYHDGKIIDIHTVISAIRDKPNFVFQRENYNKLFIPSTNVNNKRQYNSTIYNKSFKPIGFTKQSLFKEKEQLNLKTNFEELYYNLEDSHKKKSNIFTDDNNSNTITTINNSNRNSSNRTSSTLNSFSSRLKKGIIYNPISRKKNRNKINNTFSLTESTITNSNMKYNNTISNNNYINNYTLNNTKTELNISNEENVNSKIKEIINDGKIIKESLENKIEKKYKKKLKKKNDEILLKLANKVYKEEKKEEKNNNKKKEENHYCLSTEDEFVRKLKKIPKSCKEPFRQCFKEILYEDRILNKNLNENDEYFDKMKYLNEQKKIQLEAFRTMYLLKENILTGREDDEVFKEEKIFDNYGNITGLEWLIKKKYILDDKKKLIGAFNPQEKNIFDICYPE